jgi:hypothetical protein
MDVAQTPLAPDAPPGAGPRTGERPDDDPAAAERPDGLAAAAFAVWNDLRGALHERARLLTLEVRLAGLTLVQLVLYAVMVAVLIVSAWIGLMGALVVGIVSIGLHWGIGLAAGIVLNLAFAAWLVRSMFALIDRMDLQASLRRLQGGARPPE